ncbi:unnamed protein product [Ectocarpus sp. 12 AP-2014]
MNPTDIGSAYDQITHLWQSEKFNLANGMEAHKRALSFVKNRGRALDIGCGCTGRFIDLLQREGFTPEGVDISAEMLRLAKQRHPDVSFHHQDICQWQLPGKYDVITAWDSIWHIPLAQQESVITKIINSLNEGGVFIFSFGGTDEPGEHTDNFMGPEVSYSSLGTNGFLSLLMRLGTVCKHLEYDQHPELHTYLIVQKGQS